MAGAEVGSWAGMEAGEREEDLSGAWAGKVDKKQVVQQKKKEKQAW